MATLKDCEKIITHLIEHMGEELFCPLISAYCRAECVCLDHGTIERNESGSEAKIKQKPFCDNQMFWGKPS